MPNNKNACEHCISKLDHTSYRKNKGNQIIVFLHRIHTPTCVIWFAFFQRDSNKTTPASTQNNTYITFISLIYLEPGQFLSVILSEKNGCYALGDKLSHKIMEKGGDKEKEWRKEDEKECSWVWSRYYYTHNKKLITSIWINNTTQCPNQAQCDKATSFPSVCPKQLWQWLYQLCLYFCGAKPQFS